MKIESGNYCPLIKKDCIQFKCHWFSQVRGMNPVTGEDIDEWSCVVTLLPLILIEGAKNQKDTASAVYSFRNEMLKQNEQSRKVMQDNFELANRIAYNATHDNVKLIKE